MPAKRPWFEVRRSRIQGKGGFALRTIPAGTRIIEYAGERITSEEADRRYDDAKARRHHTFLFDLDGDHCIDAGRDGNDARFINHSCEPNCEAVLEDGRVFIHALARIAPRAELTYDYAYVVSGPIDAQMRRLYVCKCGAPKCRGTILAPAKKRGTRKNEK